MSYLNYFLKNFRKDETREGNCEMDKRPSKEEAQDVEKIQGSCHTMCPVDEGSLRIRERMVHVLEKVGTDTKLVKSYCRSAADSNMAVSQHLRPFNVLRVTVAYLLFEVTKRMDVPTPVVYDFIDNRLRAVRQDMTIQRLSSRQCAHLLEPMVRFYVYYGYKLHGLPLKDFDPVLHKKYLLECLKWFLSCCDHTENLEDYSDEHRTPGELGERMSMMNIEPENKLACDQVLMESLYILCNLDDVHPLRRFVNLPKQLKNDPKLRLAFSVAVANRKGNFVKVTKLLSRLCPLAHCALCQYLPDLQRRALKVLALAYDNKKLAVPSSVLKQWLALSSVAETRDVCQHYGLAVVDDSIRFDKQMLKIDVKMHQSNIRLLQSEGLNLNLLHVLTYTAK